MKISSLKAAATKPVNRVRRHYTRKRKKVKAKMVWPPPEFDLPSLEELERLSQPEQPKAIQLVFAW